MATLELDFKLRLTQLDGRPVAGIPAGFDEYDPHNPRVVRLLPGTHEMLVGLRPYAEIHTYQTYAYLPSGDCHGGVQMIPTGSYTTTTHVRGSREDERITFDVAAGRRYRAALENPLDWFSKRDRWWVKVVEQTDAWRDPVVSRSVGREWHVVPSAADDATDAQLAAHAGRLSRKRVCDRRGACVSSRSCRGFRSIRACWNPRATGRRCLTRT